MRSVAFRREEMLNPNRLRNARRAMKKKGSRIACLLLTLFMLCGFGGRVCAADTSQAAGEAIAAEGGYICTEDFDIRVTCGLQGNYRYGAAIPVNIRILSARADFDGVLRVIVPSGTEDEWVAYEKEILLTKGVEKTVSLSVNAMNYVSQFLFQVESSKGKVVVERTIEMAGRNSDSALVGVLSDDYTALNYFDGLLLSLTSYTGNTQLIELDEESFPEQASGLEALSFLVINSFDTSRLSEAQLVVIDQWVNQGGALILGTGPDYAQTVSGLNGRMFTLQANGVHEGVLMLARSLISDEYEWFPEKLTISPEDGVLDLSVENAYLLLEVLSDEQLLQVQDYGKGRIVFSSMNLGMEPLVSWEDRPVFAQRLMEKVADGAIGLRIGNLNYGNDISYSWAVNEALSAQFGSKSPQTGLILLILGLFLLLPLILYFVLKKLDKRELLWGIIPGSAIVCVMFIMLSTSNLRIRHPQTASITLLKENAYQTCNSSVYLETLLPNTGRISLSFADELANLQLRKRGYYYNSDTKPAKDYNLAIRQTAEGYHVFMKNKSTFSEKYFSFERDAKSDQAIMEGLELSATSTLMGLEGSITNNTGYDLDGVLVFSDSWIVRIEHLDKGETKSFVPSDNAMFSPSSSYYRDLFYSNMGLSEEEMGKIILSYRMIFEEYFNNGSYNFTNENHVMTMGYISDWDVDYVAEKNVGEYNAAILMREYEVPFSGYEDAIVLNLFDYAVDRDNWDPADGQLYAQSVDVAFDMRYKGFSNVHALMRGDSNLGYGTTDNVTVYALNAVTGDYDEIFAEGMVMEFDGACPYLSEDGMIRLRFTCKYEYSDYAPRITVIGGAR